MHGPTVIGQAAYEDKFDQARMEWLGSVLANGPEGYTIKLTLTDDDYDQDLFYYWCACLPAARPCAAAALSGSAVVDDLSVLLLHSLPAKLRAPRPRLAG